MRIPPTLFGSGCAILVLGLAAFLAGDGAQKLFAFLMGGVLVVSILWLIQLQNRVANEIRALAARLRELERNNVAPSAEPAAARPAVDLDVIAAQIDAARSANDADRVLTLHREMAVVLSGGELERREQALVPWFMALLMRRLRGGTVSVEVTDLAARIADTFATTPEGASLRASLPTLRRSAGLCPRCAKPYAGIEAACPDCLKAAQPAEMAPVSADQPAAGADNLDDLVREDDEERRTVFDNPP